MNHSSNKKIQLGVNKLNDEINNNNIGNSQQVQLVITTISKITYLYYYLL